uniref:hypothetical protein n=1 Tax=Aerococcus urinaeequi TaxID=51665 RepID=UPI00352B1778
MAFKVTQAIRDSKDDNHYYDTGDIFPREGLKVDDERVAELVDGGYIAEENDDLSKLKKDELVALAVEKGIEVDTKDTKAEIIEKLEV